MSAAGHVSFFRHPQRIWWRAALFQIHLWTGLVVGVYVCAIGLSGSVIVLGEELTRLSRPDLFKPSTTQTDSPRDRVPAILAAAERGFPQFRFTGIFFPTSKSPTVQLEGRSLNPQRPSDFVNVYIDPVTTRILGSTDRHFWISVTRQLHVRLLAGQAGFHQRNWSVCSVVPCGIGNCPLVAGSETLEPAIQSRLSQEVVAHQF